MQYRTRLDENEIQKQYERYEDIWSIMHCMKELYTVLDQHNRYVVMKAFIGARIIEGSSIRKHGVIMLSLVEKLKDLQADFNEKEMDVDLILQSLPSSFDQFIISYNMNVLKKSLHDLINMLVQYEATIKKFASVLVERLQPLKRRAKLPDARREDLSPVSI
ncbi:UNVERIFIED_CONTAM: hypothetical protein Scaly_1155400 [Sesamum calycinum]|uniref:Retrovirus-related Pol polyprotein from transposon TNT 1-94 n=1 Tax=Sesamum calycinum TaxID=2727403 RepID=A0AAW2Q2L3_9LAMI